MMPFVERACEVIEIPVAGSTPVALPLGLGFIPTMFDHRLGSTMRTSHTLGPAHLTNRRETLGIVNDCPDVQYVMNLVSNFSISRGSYIK